MLHLLKNVENNSFGTECLVHRPNKLNLSTFGIPGPHNCIFEHLVPLVKSR